MQISAVCVKMNRNILSAPLTARRAYLCVMQKTLALVDLSAIRHNAKYIRALACGKKVYGVVKADAYGHGAPEVARETQDIFDGFCVAIVDEGVQLRLSGITKPVLVLAPPLDEYDVGRAAFYGLEMSVGDMKSARLCRGVIVHIAVNTGMNRYGCNISELGAIIAEVGAENIGGVYSHLYAADDDAACARQLELFRRAEAEVRTVCPDATFHLSASGGLLRGGEYLFDGVRAGIMLYGYAPHGFAATGLKRAMKVYARRAQSVDFIGGGVGYNRADRPYKKLYTYRLGYADGFSRTVPLGEKTLCMDSFISRAGLEYMPVMTDADEYAEKCGTISYEVLCSVTRRSLRIYERSAEI